MRLRKKICGFLCAFEKTFIYLLGCAGSQLQQRRILELQCAWEHLVESGRVNSLYHMGSSSPTRERTQTPFPGNTESQLLDHQGSPKKKNFDQLYIISSAITTQKSANKIPLGQGFSDELILGLAFVGKIVFSFQLNSLNRDLSLYYVETSAQISLSSIQYPQRLTVRYLQCCNPFSIFIFPSDEYISTMTCNYYLDSFDVSFREPF